MAVLSIMPMCKTLMCVGPAILERVTLEGWQAEVYAALLCPGTYEYCARPALFNGCVAPREHPDSFSSGGYPETAAAIQAAKDRLHDNLSRTSYYHSNIEQH